MDDISITTARISGRRILVVEDDYLLGDAVAMILQDEGAEVVGPVGRTADALSLIRDRRTVIDLAVLDVNLGGERSYPIADALLDRGIPFLFTTGYGADAVETAYRGHPRCEKPLSARALIAAMSRLAGGAGPGPG